MLDLSRTSAPAWFSVEEVAQAAGASVDEAWHQVALGQAVVYGPDHLVATADAIHLVRLLRGEVKPSANYAPFNQIQQSRGRVGKRVAGAVGAYGLAALLGIGIPALGLLDPASHEQRPIKNDEPVRLVYLMMPGPGGGGGGGGLAEPLPPPPAKVKPLVTIARKTISPVPPMRPRAAPPAPAAPPRPEPRIELTPVEKPPAPIPPAVQAPVKTIAADPLDVVGLPFEGPTTSPSQGPGLAGGVGSGAGQGLGSGTGGGIGPGSGGGTGGGPYGPGSGIDPPTLVKEIRASYTDAARRQAIEGDVVLEIVVRADGSVGNVRVRRTLGAGLEQKAIDAVRQWRFIPAKRHGTPVDVTVDVSVEFKLR